MILVKWEVVIYRKYQNKRTLTPVTRRYSRMFSLSEMEQAIEFEKSKKLKGYETRLVLV